jgi:hypothetical protein
MTAEETTDHPSMNGNEITVLSVVLTQMTVMESRLLARMDANAAAAKDRWQNHDEQHEEWEKSLKALSHRLDHHLADEERRDLVIDARLGPIRTGMYWASREWRTVLIVLLLLGNILSRFIHFEPIF